MGSRSRFKVKDRKVCVRCTRYIMNVFTKSPFCDDCRTDLQGMTFDGEQVLTMIMDIMPPTPPHPDAAIKAFTVIKLARAVLQQEGLLLPDDEADDSKSKSSLIVE